MVLLTSLLTSLLLFTSQQAAATPTVPRNNHQIQDLSSPITASPPPLLLQSRSSSSSSCSATTFTNITGFILTEYLVNTVEVAGTNQTQTIATFGILNLGTGETYRLDRIPISTGGGTWSVCRAGETPIPSALERCQYLIERGGARSGRIGFRLQWRCDGAGGASKPYVFLFFFWVSSFFLSLPLSLPPHFINYPSMCFFIKRKQQRRILFDATMIATLPFEVCTDREGEGGVLLSCEMSQTEVDLPFANISWEEAPSAGK